MGSGVEAFILEVSVHINALSQPKEIANLLCLIYCSQITKISFFRYNSEIV